MTDGTLCAVQSMWFVRVIFANVSKAASSPVRFDSLRVRIRLPSSWIRLRCAPKSTAFPHVVARHSLRCLIYVALRT